MSTSETHGSGHYIDEWLRAGGVIVASSERTARAIRSAFTRRRLAEGHTAWLTPQIHEWRAFLRTQWDRLPSDGRMVMSIPQEESVWARIAAAGKLAATVLHGPRYRLANMAREAHELPCSYAWQFLDADARTAWLGDAEFFGQWLAEFDKRCTKKGWLSAARLPVEMLSRLPQEQTERPKLLLTGLDRLLPVQRAFLDTWGPWEQEDVSAPLATTKYYMTPNASAELAACALWCRTRLAVNPDARLLVISQDAGKRRGGDRARLFSAHLAYDRGTSGRVLAGSPTFPDSSLPRRPAHIALVDQIHLGA